MLFNSYIFLLLFLPLTLLGWWQIRKTPARLMFLTLASYAFYGFWDWRFLPLMIASTTVDYIAGLKIWNAEDSATRKRWLAGSLTFNLLILGFFKYYGFFAASVNQVATKLGMSHAIPVLAVILPIGISFYTFNSMSYTIDIYRNIVRPAKSLLHFSAFVALFPHLVAGPIVRYSDIEDQLAALKARLSFEQAGRGIQFFVIGIAKKLFIADNLAPVVNAYFNAPSGQPLITAWLGVLGYTFQLYFDFSAYSDMAVGLAHLLGIQFPQNFNSPYKALNISDFWRRWHISLSTWLRDYLFIPLGGSQRGLTRTVANLAITMFLGGLWHGANWTFVIWGLYHGVLLASYQVLRSRGWVPRSKVAAQSVTFLAVVIGWVFFRAETLPKALTILAAMSGANGIAGAYVPHWYLVVLVLAAAMAFIGPTTWEIKWKPLPSLAYAAAVVLFFAILLVEKESPFLYFQF